MKRIIFSIWSDLTQHHDSVPDWKKSSLHKFKDTLIKRQKEYAEYCGAKYFLFETKFTDYVNVQFDKIFKFEKLTEKYDEVVYFDLDIIPVTKKNIFDSFDFNYPCVYEYDVNQNTNDTLQKNWLSQHFHENKTISPMNRYSKVAAKKAMLLLEDVSGNDNICNTAVLCGNKNAANLLQFNKRINDIDKILLRAKNDTIYPNEYSEGWVRNNEVYFSFILERYNIKFNNIGIQWNYILDDLITEFTPAAHLIHQVNKDFKKTFTLLQCQ